MYYIILINLNTTACSLLPCDGRHLHLAILTLINLVMPHVLWEPFTFGVNKRNWQLVE